MVPLYLAASAVSWALTGDFGARNVFERRAGLADGGYTDKPLRAGLQRVRPGAVSGSGRLAGAAGRPLPWPASAGRDGSTASPSR